MCTVLQGWSPSYSLGCMGGGRASIMVQSSRLHLDSTCRSNLDTLKAPDCYGRGELGPVSPTPREPSPTNPRVASQAASGASVGEIGGIAVGAVIIALLAVLIVIVLIVVMMKWKSKLLMRFVPYKIA